MPAKPQHGFRWDDARVLLALHRTRTLSAAAASLGVDASTVGRRIDVLEQSIGARLFDRTPDGAVPTLAADELLPHAEAMELAAMELAGSAEAFERAVEGVVRISVPPGIADLLLVPLLPKLRAKHPQLRIDLDARVGYVDLARREADLVLRGMRPTHGEIVTVRLATARAIPVAQRAFAEHCGNVRDPSSLPWITYGHDLGHIDDARWVASVAPESAIVLRTSSFSAQIAAVEAGFGVTVVGEPLIAARRELVPLRFTRAAAARLPPYPEGSLWMAVHRALRGVPRVAALWDFLVEEVSAQLPRAARAPAALKA
jgi:DNA-binding transcriptional LysR family regulator